MNSSAETNVTTWTVDAAHTQVEFVVKHMVFAKVRGHFSAFEGEIQLGPEGDLSNGHIAAKIETNSINTSQAQRDEHLRSGDFFNVEQFPHITFESTDIQRISDSKLTVRGALTIRDIQKEVVLDVIETGTGVDPWGNLRFGLQATGTIDRNEFGLTWNQALEAGGVLVGNDISLILEVQAVASSK